MNKNILAIDFSLNGTALVYGNGDKNNISYKYFSPLKKDAKNPNCIEINKDMSSEQKLDYAICTILCYLKKTDLLVLENASYNSVNSNNAFKGGYHIILYLARQLNIPYLLVSPISNKLFFTGNAKATKDDMKKELNKYSTCIKNEDISPKHLEDIADCFALYNLGYIFEKYNRLPAKKGCIDTSDIKPFESLPLHQQQVIAKLRGREDLYKEIVKLRNKKGE